MITARQFRNGIVIEMQNNLFVVQESQHIKPGKGGAFVRAKLKNLQTGAIAEQTFRPSDSFQQAFIEEQKVQYLYKEHSIYYFMNQATYEQTGITQDIIGDNVKLLKDGMEISASFYKDTIIGITLPSFVKLRVTYTEPGIKGDTARGGSKPATLETGTVIKVPLFINTDDVIKIDTRTGQYSGRA
ncbi:MAG: elongation factor P [Candidatus Omnitrophica bacterium]|nr:elongation factor P [Candidatus Omnitrophota bacterium]